MPVMTYYAVPATSRASMAFYNTFEEIDRLAAALIHARELLA
jgi:cysteine desulfurase/selenocysteine lyase